MSTHTPGPWAAIVAKPSKKDQRGTAMVRAGGSMAIECADSGDTFAESAANARLIAAAPDLLTQLRVALTIFKELGISGGSNIENMRTALAKAEGSK